MCHVSCVTSHLYIFFFYCFCDLLASLFSYTKLLYGKGGDGSQSVEGLLSMLPFIIIIYENCWHFQLGY